MLQQGTVRPGPGEANLAHGLIDSMRLLNNTHLVISDCEIQCE